MGSIITWQAAQLVLGAQLDGQHGAVLRFGLSSGSREQLVFGHFLAQFGEGIFVIRREQLARRLFLAVEAVVTQVADLEVLRIILLVLEIVLVGLGVVLFRDGLELGLGFRLLRYQPCLELTGQVADFVLAAGNGRGVVRVARGAAVGGDEPELEVEGLVARRGPLDQLARTAAEEVGLVLARVGRVGMGDERAVLVDAPARVVEGVRVGRDSRAGDRTDRVRSLR